VSQPATVRTFDIEGQPVRCIEKKSETTAAVGRSPVAGLDAQYQYASGVALRSRQEG
jgi:hypothetical protein